MHVMRKYNANPQRICIFFFICHLSFVSLSSQIMPHFVTKFAYETFYVRFVTVQGLRPWIPAPPSTCTPFPVPPHHMPAIIKVTQAANFNVLIG